MTVPQQLTDRYELGEILGFGGMSEVHRARDVRLHRDVAIKILRADLVRDPSFSQRFRREAKHTAALNHPSIVAVFDTGEADTPTGKLPFLVMEFVEGQTVGKLIQQHGAMAPHRAISIIAEVCTALEFSHNRGIVHRDIKPANIMITPTGAVKVMDFGIAHAMNATTGDRLTATSAVVGTAQYFSPEQARGQEVDARTDVYSLGCVLYEMLTGQALFTGDTPLAVAYQHVRERPVPPSQRRAGISPELDAVVLKALAKKPDKRYQSAAEMHADLLRVGSGKAPEAPAQPPADTDETPAIGDPHPHTLQLPVQERRGSSRRWLITGALAAVTLLVLAGVYVVGTMNRVQVPDVHGLTRQDAVSRLQDRGLTPQVDTKPDGSVEAGRVIDTDPAADAPVASGSDVTVNVSTGPEQRRIPDVSTLTYDDAVRTLRDAGFDNVRRTSQASKAEQKDRVVETIPAAQQDSATSNEIVIVVGSGPATRQVPDVTGQTEDQARQNLGTAGFTTILRTDADSTLPVGQVASTDPPAGASVASDAPITVKVSRGNQFPMPVVTNFFYNDLVAYLASFGFVGRLDKGPDIDAGPQNRNKVVQQDPAPGVPVNRDGAITVNYGS
ncbi:serine/threonine protein kinase [Mycolicibacterium canariasense]|uniref:Serine/threonine-protein kinase PknB n=1 Tax=Mycolicibacterium canariasense TaxID=228230 RepID=A0A100WE83_MYCCR|nr:Stk1 family PASTA domain-containing Ser/Thr kinase [Mycolicibacterium canariasense]MCV7211596.1 Stk1 family PASTA domain-containing Ser/Thr kinase [Mycolicibacterium canariasense]ORV00392.1 serine/threonine protein kinase [Mycolicibacterium canariasense]GAS96997.1 serine/threonine protein kinase [Mycolicibacterium canariasense]